MLGTAVRRGKGVRFEVEGVQVGVSGFRREKNIYLQGG